MLHLDHGLFKAICDNPHDDMPRLLMADWLEERAESQEALHRAEFIRLQIETAKVLPADIEASLLAGTSFPNMTSLNMVMHEFLGAHRHYHNYADRWAAPFGSLRPVFRRGFIDRIACETGLWQNNWIAFIEMLPLTQVWLTGPASITHRNVREHGVYWNEFTLLGCKPWRFMIDQRTFDDYRFSDVRQREMFVESNIRSSFQQMCPNIHFRFEFNAPATQSGGSIMRFVNSIHGPPIIMPPMPLLSSVTT